MSGAMFDFDHFNINHCGGASSCASPERPRQAARWYPAGVKTPWRFLTAAEGRTLEAICEQIIPPTRLPAPRGPAWSTSSTANSWVRTAASAPYRAGLTEITGSRIR